MTPSHSSKPLVKKRTNLLLKKSTVRKAISRAQIQTLHKALRGTRTITFASLEKSERTKTYRRLVRATTSRALDMIKISDRQKRATIQKAIQEYLNSVLNSQDKITQQNALKIIETELPAGKSAQKFITSCIEAAEKSLTLRKI